ncbi:MAG TPA: 30S ribosomal protein S16 [Candidatus Sumerlaeota bacterium]|nr:30S ribosomal protein S16 [Candidatus Sumerlaeota bacterium]
MAVKIRLTRMGRKKAPYFRVVVADQRFQRDGRFLEILGFYHPMRKDAGEEVKVDQERAIMWMGRGARPSETVRALFRKIGILKKFHESRKKPSAPVKTEGGN